MGDKEAFLEEVALEASKTRCVGVSKVKWEEGRATGVALEGPGGWEVKLGFYPRAGSP